MCRNASGGVDESLKETIKNIVRYWVTFHNVSDAAELAELMFPLTGNVPVETPMNGRYETVSTATELDRNRRRFMNLRQREAYHWDKIGGKPHFFVTPEMEIPDLDAEKIADFERAILKRIGRPRVEIEAEISERRAAVDALAQRSTFAVPAAKKPERQLGAYKPGGAA